MRRTFSILFVCAGNTCRSPLAEAIFKAELAGRRTRKVLASSAGTNVRPGDGTSRNAIAAAKALGVNLRWRSAKPLTATRVSRADLILTMTEAQKESVVERWPEARDRTASICRFSGSGRGGIKDPMGGPESAYLECARVLRTETKRMMTRLSRTLKDRGTCDENCAGQRSRRA